MSADFVAHMEDVLDLYAEPYDPQRPVVCFDETSTQFWPTPGHPSQRRPDSPGVRTRSIGGRALATCSWPVNPWLVGGRWR